MGMISRMETELGKNVKLENKEVRGFTIDPTYEVPEGFVPINFGENILAEIEKKISEKVNEMPGNIQTIGSDLLKFDFEGQEHEQFGDYITVHINSDLEVYFNKVDCSDTEFVKSWLKSASKNSVKKGDKIYISLLYKFELDGSSYICSDLSYNDINLAAKAVKGYTAEIEIADNTIYLVYSSVVNK